MCARARGRALSLAQPCRHTNLRRPCGAAANDARREALRLLEDAEWVGFDLPAADEPSAFILR